MNSAIFVVALVCVLGIMWLVFFAMVARAYVKVPPGRALVRTGGFFRRPDALPKVVMNGGAWVFGFIHEVAWVDLRTVPIEIERLGQDALMTSDSQRADIKTVLYVKVVPTIEGIVDAARSIGGQVVDANVIESFVTPKLYSTLRDAVMTSTLVDLHNDGEKFVQDIQMRLKRNLEDNGLMLENMSILKLEVTQ